MLVLAGFAVVAGAATADASGQSYRIDSERTTAAFSVTELGFARARGQLGRASGSIVVDPAEPAGGHIDVTVDLAAVSTGWDLRDEFLRGERMFDVARHPVVHFRSDRLLYRDGRIVATEGAITLHGVTKPARLAVRMVDCGRVAAGGHARCEATVTGHVHRREFGMGFAWPLVGDEVELEIAIGAERVE